MTESQWPATKGRTLKTNTEADTDRLLPFHDILLRGLAVSAQRN
jgi:hypothetical protein